MFFGLLNSMIGIFLISTMTIAIAERPAIFDPRCSESIDFIEVK